MIGKVSLHDFSEMICKVSLHDFSEKIGKVSLHDFSEMDNTYSRVVIQWIPSCCSVAGNDAAKEGGRLPQTDSSTAYKEAKSVIKRINGQKDTLTTKNKRCLLPVQ